MPCNHDHDQAEDDTMFDAVIHYMVRTYCAGREVRQTVITVHAHETGPCDDRLLTLHVATGPESAARLAAHSVIADMTEVVIREQMAGRN
jgi:hypothetical protein